MPPTLPTTEAPSSDDRLLMALAARPGDAERAHLEQLVAEHYLPLAHRRARRYAGRGIDLDDLESVAGYALVKAIRGFSPSRGAFVAYAVATIDGELKRHFRDHGWAIRPPRSVQELRPRVQAILENRTDSDRRAAVAAAAAELEVSRAAVNEALGSGDLYTIRSLDAAWVGEDGAGTTQGSRLSGDQNVVDGRSMEDRVCGIDLLARCCEGLDDADRQLVLLRYYQDMTQIEIAAVIGISQVQVSRRLRKLIELMRSHALDDHAA